MYISITIKDQISLMTSCLRVLLMFGWLLMQSATSIASSTLRSWLPGRVQGVYIPFWCSVAAILAALSQVILYSGESLMLRRRPRLVGLDRPSLCDVRVAHHGIIQPVALLGLRSLWCDLCKGCWVQSGEHILCTASSLLDWVWVQLPSQTQRSIPTWWYKLWLSGVGGKAGWSLMLPRWLDILLDM